MCAARLLVPLHHRQVLTMLQVHKTLQVLKMIQVLTTLQALAVYFTEKLWLHIQIF